MDMAVFDLLLLSQSFSSVVRVLLLPANVVVVGRYSHDARRNFRPLKMLGLVAVMEDQILSIDSSIARSGW